MKTCSGSGSLRIAVRSVPVRPPKLGMCALATKSRVGSISTISTTSVSPFSAPSTKMGPVCGLTYGHSSTCVGRSASLWTRDPNASSVKMSSSSPGRTVAIGSAYGPNTNE